MARFIGGKLRILIYANEGDRDAQAKLNELKADGRASGRRNAELWAGNVEPARAVFVFPNKNADAITAAYRAAGVEVIYEGDEISGQKEDGQISEEIQADEGQGEKAEDELEDDAPLDVLTVAQLREKAGQLGIELRSSMTKAAIIEAIEAN